LVGVITAPVPVPVGLKDDGAQVLVAAMLVAALPVLVLVLLWTTGWHASPCPGQTTLGLDTGAMTVVVVVATPWVLTLLLLLAGVSMMVVAMLVGVGRGGDSTTGQIVVETAIVSVTTMTELAPEVQGWEAGQEVIVFVVVV
jgi:hypothetical protein